MPERTNKGPVIRPSHIDTSDHFWDTFDNRETEASARLIVTFCQEREGDDWRSFTKKELDERFKEDFWFNKLTEPKGDYAYLERKGGTVRVTDRFIKTCFGSRGVLRRPEG